MLKQFVKPFRGNSADLLLAHVKLRRKRGESHAVQQPPLEYIAVTLVENPFVD